MAVVHFVSLDIQKGQIQTKGGSRKEVNGEGGQPNALGHVEKAHE